MTEYTETWTYHDVEKLLRKFAAVLELVDQAVDGGSVVIPTVLIIQALETP